MASVRFPSFPSLVLIVGGTILLLLVTGPNLVASYELTIKDERDEVCNNQKIDLVELGKIILHFSSCKEESRI